MGYIPIFLKKNKKNLDICFKAYTFAARSLRIILSRKTEGIDPMKSWQPLLIAGRCQFQLSKVALRKIS
jgi:hypothetical protein